mgnify:CR=1 FL=1
MRLVRLLYNQMFSCPMISRPMSTPMTEAVIRQRVQPEESPRQWRRRMFVLRSASIFTRLEQNIRSGKQSSVSCETKPGTTGSRFNERGFFRKLCARSAAGTERSRRR